MRIARSLIAGAAIAIVAVTGAILAQPLLTTHQNMVSIQNESGSIILGVPSGSSACPVRFANPSSIHAYGFLKAMEGQLVMQPNSTAFAKIDYVNVAPELTVSSMYNESSIFSLGPSPPNQWLHKIVGNNDAGIRNNTETGLSIYVLNVTISPLHTNMSITYELIVSPNAPIGTYLGPFWGFCVGPLLTIGSSYYNGTYGRGVFWD